MGYNERARPDMFCLIIPLIRGRDCGLGIQIGKTSCPCSVLVPFGMIPVRKTVKRETSQMSFTYADSRASSTAGACLL